LPEAVRASPDLALVRLAHQAALDHSRHLRTVLECAMVEQQPLYPADLELLGADPIGRPMLEGLLVKQSGATGRPWCELSTHPGAVRWWLETVPGDSVPLVGPLLIPHPVELAEQGRLAEFEGWWARRGHRQPFRQLRRQTYRPGADAQTHTFTSCTAGALARWDQARAILEGRGWHRITKLAAERRCRLCGHPQLAAFLEFRTPRSSSHPRDCVVFNRLFFLGTGELPVSKGSPGLPLARVPVIVYSEAVRDAVLVAAVGRRQFREPEGQETDDGSKDW
jgi:hypothetical protein